ncbi:uncharacterized protein [Littorina saxatilis]|uniref:uncharacterized protein n=1 Tax=Littorina saxatilis TaxID=31220 RepID=UPI0038B59BBC
MVGKSGELLRNSRFVPNPKMSYHRLNTHKAMLPFTYIWSTRKNASTQSAKFFGFPAFSSWDHSDYAFEESSLQTGRRGDQSSDWASQRRRTEGYGGDKTGSSSGQHQQPRGGRDRLSGSPRRGASDGRAGAKGHRFPKTGQPAPAGGGSSGPRHRFSCPGVHYGIHFRMLRHATPDGPAANLARSITGEKSHFVPVDLFIDDKLKTRIWSQEAIDLATLVKGEDHGSYDITISKSADGPSFSIRDAPNKATVLSESSWTAAWNIYAAIYTQRFPTAMQGLAVHFQQVQQLMLERGDWRGYDRAFRRMVQQGLQQWGVASPALYTSARLKFVHGAMAAPHHSGDSPAAVWQRGGRNRAPKGFCYEFHLKNSCNKLVVQAPVLQV